MTTTSSFHINDVSYSLPPNIAATELTFTITLQNVTPLSQMYWAVYWNFSDSANTGGYTGLQPRALTAGPNGIYTPGINWSVWNATSGTAGTGSQMEHFTGAEGEGERITHATPVTTGLIYTFDLLIHDGTLTETVTDSGGNNFVTGSIAAPSPTFADIYYFSEYYGAQNSATLPLGEAQISNVLINGMPSLGAPTERVFVSSVVINDSLPYIEATGPDGYYNTSSGAVGANLTMLLASTQATVDAGPGTNTVKIAPGYNDLSQDNFTNIQIIDGGGQDLSVTAPLFSSSVRIINASSVSISGGELSLSGTASQYTLTPADDGTHITLSGNGATYNFSGPTALKFSDYSEITSAAPGTDGVVTSGNIAELYSAIFDRVPDIAGFTFYNDYLKANPATGILQFALWFLDSPEYTSNNQISGDRGGVGDQLFITNCYWNLLNRPPSNAEIAFYLTRVITPIETTAGLTQQNFKQAQIQAYAQMLVYFSNAPEFLSDVTVTAQHPADNHHWLVLI